MSKLNEEEIIRLKKLGHIHATILQELKNSARIGTETLEFEKNFINLLSKFKNIRSGCKGYKPSGHKIPYPTNLCVSINEEAVHVPPSTRIIKPGDLVTIDLILTDGVIFTDSAISFIVEQEAAPLTRRRLLQTAYNALYTGISFVTEHAPLGKISSTIYQTVKQAGFDVLKDYGGHGIGKHIWEEPFIPNYGSPTQGPKLSKHQAIAIEPLVTAGSDQLIQLNDWATKTLDNSDFVQVEHTILVTDNKPEIITKI